MTAHEIRPLGAAIRRKRYEAGVSLGVLSSETGLTAERLEEVETTGPAPTVGELDRISRALDVEPLALFGEDPDYTDTRPSEREMTRLLKAFRCIDDPEVRVNVIALLEQISESHGLAESLLAQVPPAG